MKLKTFIASALLCLACASVHAADFQADFQKGFAAYNKGDYSTALQEWRPLADQGDANAQDNLGGMYRDGQGVPQDYTEAAKWYRKAADQGDANGQNNLGVLYHYGQGVPQDYTEALKWYRKAADQGDANGQNNLGVLYLHGQGVPQNDTEALKWYRKAADQGDADAQDNLGGVYRFGLGVPRDLTLAYMLYNLAAAGGYDFAVKDRNGIIEIMAPAQIKEGQALASNWRVGTPLPKSSKTGRASVKISEEKQSKPVADNSGISEDGSCRPAGSTIRCQSQCVNGNCIVTYENGCKVRVQVQPQYDPINNLWTYPAPSC